MADITLISTSAISGAVAVLAALVGAYATGRSANMETRRQQWEYRQKRRSERQETYQTAIDLLTDWGWRHEDKKFDVVRDFTILFVRAANRVRVYGSPASVAAMDELQAAFAQLNRAHDDHEFEAAYEAIRKAHDHFVIAARADVGPQAEDGLAPVPFREGAGPTA
jgi:hypothetical protein